MQKSSQNESAITIVGSVICGVLITLLVLSWLSRRNKELVQSMLFEKQISVEQSVNNKNEKTMTQSEVLSLIKTERLQMENDMLKKDIATLTASLKMNERKEPVVVSIPPQVNYNEKDLRELRNNISNVEDKLGEKIDALHSILKSTQSATVAVVDPRIDLLIQEVRSLKQNLATMKANSVVAPQQPQQIAIPNQVVPQQVVDPVVRQPQPLSPVPSQRPVAPQVRQQAQATALDIRKDLGPDPQDVKQRYKNDELK